MAGAWKMMAEKLAQEVGFQAPALPALLIGPDGWELRRLQGLPVRGKQVEERTILRCAGRWFALLDRLGHGASCLTRSLVLARVLRHGGHDARLVFGARSDNGRREGHCWVTVQGRTVAGEVSGFEELRCDGMA